MRCLPRFFVLPSREFLVNVFYRFACFSFCPYVVVYSCLFIHFVKSIIRGTGKHCLHRISLTLCTYSAAATASFIKFVFRLLLTLPLLASFVQLASRFPGFLVLLFQSQLHPTFSSVCCRLWCCGLVVVLICESTAHFCNVSLDLLSCCTSSWVIEGNIF